MPIAAGQVILNGKYRILRLLGEGGMARVWLAEELTFGDRPVALKEPRPDLAPIEHDLVLRRFDRECKVCAALAQARVPHVAQAITAEPYEGSALLAMDFMAGGDLAGRIKRYPNGLPLDQALQIAADLCEALAGAHGHDLEIVHRDIKPNNVLFDPQGNAYLADFGAAQVARASVQLTEQLGYGSPHTPLYAAPEQTAGQAYLTPAADIFALGCVIFEMLTGRPVKRLPPGTRMQQVRPDLPAWLDPIVARCLAVDPWQRWQNAGELKEALSGRAAQSSRPPQQHKADRRVPVAMGLAAAGLLLVGLLVYVSLAGSRGGTDRAAQPAPTSAGALTIGEQAAEPGATAAPATDAVATIEPARVTPAPPAATVAIEEAATTTASPSPAPTATPAPRLTVTQDGVPVYAGPAEVYPVRAILRSGQSFEISGRDAGAAWWQLNYQNEPVWIPAALVNVDGNPAQIPIRPDLALTPVPQPLFSTLSLVDVANANLGDGYVAWPQGYTQLDAVPFDLKQGQTVTTQARPLPGNPTEITIPAGVANARAVYVLLTGGNMFSNFDQQAIGEVRLIFENGRHVVRLACGQNVREWQQRADLISRTTSPQVKQVWQSTSKTGSAPVVIDMLTIPIPADLQASPLLSVQVIDQSQQTVKDMDPAINLIGVSVLSYR